MLKYFPFLQNRILGSATLGRKGSSGLSSVLSRGAPSSGHSTGLSGLASGLSSGYSSGLSSGGGGGGGYSSSGIPKWSSPVKTDGMLAQLLGGDAMTRSTLVRQRVLPVLFQ